MTFMSGILTVKLAKTTKSVEK